MKKTLLLILTFSITLGSLFSQKVKTEVKPISFTENSDCMTVAVSYPEFPEYAEFSKKLEEFSLKSYEVGKDTGITLYNEMIPEMGDFYEEYGIKYDYSLDYEVSENEDYLSVLFMEGTFYGGPHGQLTYYSFTINKKTGKAPSLKKLVGMNYKQISKACRQSLYVDLLEEEDYDFEEDETNWLIDYIDSGTGPSGKFYGTFVVCDDKVIIVFDPYAVAPYVYGPQFVELPLKN